jgi:uncharacterized protein (TIGR02996 family)
VTATTSDRQAFLDKIAENPDDLTTRLVYADWLDENATPNIHCLRCSGCGVDPTETWREAVGVRIKCTDCNGQGLAPSNVYRQLACGQRLYVAAQAVIARPDEDGPRLEYAKICEAYGRVERAEFIRVQCELAKRGLANAWGDGSDLRRRQHQLWQLILPTFKPAEILMISFDQDSEADLGEGSYALVRRGFVDTVSMTLNQFLTHGQAICREHPVRPHAGMVTDKVPSDTGNRSWWSWWRYFGLDDTDTIASELFDLLDGFVALGDGDPDRRAYESREAAMLALSRACIKWARGERKC